MVAGNDLFLHRSTFVVQERPSLLKSPSKKRPQSEN